MEGPSLVILREELAPFLNKKILKVTGNTKQPKELLKGRTLSKIQTWGKVLFLTFKSSRKSEASIMTRTHFLMFGSYRINDPKEGRDPRLQLNFKNGIVYFYSCALSFEGRAALKELDPRVDLLSPKWDEQYVVELMGRKPSTPLCDLFLDQSVFAGSGNIVKNEVLFNLRRHPLTKLSAIAKKDWPLIAQAVREYCENFYDWKKKFELRQHWQVYRQRSCKLCGEKIVNTKLGKNLRRTFYCETHQPLHKRKLKLQTCPVLPVKSPARREERIDH